MADITTGQHGKRNPNFIYQGTLGLSIRATLYCKAKGKDIPNAYNAAPPKSGENRCGVER